MIRLACLALLMLSLTAVAEDFVEGGHLKARLNWTDYPDNSVLDALVDSPAFDQGANLRLKLRVGVNHWQAEVDYQLLGQFGDSLELLPGASNLLPATSGIQDDSNRLFNLTALLGAASDHQTLHRLDRLSVACVGEQWVTKVGRQAVSWGNGLLYNPVDIFNPFDPAAVDKEYKSGDDMAYGQFLRKNGDDLQLVWVVRRDEQRNLSASVNSLAVKYHGFVAEAEYDVLIADHYDEAVFAVGGVVPWGGAVLRGDISLTDVADESITSAVLSAAYSWVGLGKNMSGVIEYYYNGLGLAEGFDLDPLQRQPALTQRLSRGELFTFGKHYLAGSVLTEVNPLLNLSSNVFINVADHSVLAQLVGSWNFRQNWQLLIAINVPVGDSDTEYGGIETPQEGVELSPGSVAACATGDLLLSHF